MNKKDNTNDISNGKDDGNSGGAGGTGGNRIVVTNPKHKHNNNKNKHKIKRNANNLKDSDSSGTDDETSHPNTLRVSQNILKKQRNKKFSRSVSAHPGGIYSPIDATPLKIGTTVLTFEKPKKKKKQKKQNKNDDGSSSDSDDSWGSNDKLKIKKQLKSSKKDEKSKKQSSDSDNSDSSSSNSDNSGDSSSSVESSSNSSNDSSSNNKSSDSDDSDDEEDDEASDGDDDFGDLAAQMDNSGLKPIIMKGTHGTQGTSFDDPNNSDTDDSDWFGDEPDGVSNEKKEERREQSNKEREITEILKTIDSMLITESNGSGGDDDEFGNFNNMDPLSIEKIISQFSKLNECFNESPELISAAIRTHIIPIMEMLTNDKDENIIIAVLKTIKTIINHEIKGEEFLQKMCLVQLIPSIGKMVRSESEQVKSYVAPFLRRFCFINEKYNIKNKKVKNKNKNKVENSEDFNKSVRQMFIACGGIEFLVHALKNKYTIVNKDIIFTSIDCLNEIFLSGSRLHNQTDLARLFIRAKLLKPLCDRLKDVINDYDDEKAVEYGYKMAKIVYSLARLPNPIIKTAISGNASMIEETNTIEETKDSIEISSNNNQDSSNHTPSKSSRVGVTFSSANSNDNTSNNSNNNLTIIAPITPAAAAHRKQTILEKLFGVLPALEKDIRSESSRKHFILLEILKAIDELSKTETCIEALIKQHTMARIVPFLSCNNEDIQTSVVSTLFYMTRVEGPGSAQSFKESAMHGAIPHVKSLVKKEGNHKFTFFLVQTICKFPLAAHDSTLFELWKHNMCQFYLDITKSSWTIAVHIYTQAINALSRWFEQPKYRRRLEFILCQPDNVTQLINIFKAGLTAQNNQKRTTIITAFQKFFAVSAKMADALGNSNLFISALGDWLTDQHVLSENKIILLKMIVQMFDQLQSQTQKKCAKSILPVLDKIWNNYDENGLFVLRYQVEKELSPKVWNVVEEVDKDSLSDAFRQKMEGN